VSKKNNYQPIRRIELIGPSGVGKTTLFEKFDAVSKNNRHFITLKEAYKSAALNCDISIKQVPLFCYQQILKFGLFKRKERGLGKVILQRHNKRIDGREKYNRFTVSFDIQYRISDYKNPFLIKKSILKFLKKVDNYLLLEKYLPGNDLVMMDEGMILYHRGITDYALQTYSKAQLVNDPAFNPSGIIYCVQPEEKIFEQPLKRKENGVVTFTHGPLDREELREYVGRNVSHNKLKAERFKNLGMPLHEIDTMEDFKHIMVKINDFVASLDK